MVRGTLSNGLSYYIKRNVEPRDRAQLSLVVRAGSVLEEEAQRGLAHFVEHMAFNGTQRFAKQQIVDYIESIGSSFGADLNAGTSYDYTVYWLEFPTDDPEIPRDSLPDPQRLGLCDQLRSGGSRAGTRSGVGGVASLPGALDRVSRPISTLCSSVTPATPSGTRSA